MAELGLATECVGFSEVDKFAVSVYERHFPNTKNYGDTKQINTDELPDFDLLVGKFPCQDVSIIDKRASLAGERTGLFYELARILEAKQPRYFVFENVKGLLSSNEGKAGSKNIKTITCELLEGNVDLFLPIDEAMKKYFGSNGNRSYIEATTLAMLIKTIDGSTRATSLTFDRSKELGVNEKEGLLIKPNEYLKLFQAHIQNQKNVPSLRHGKYTYLDAVAVSAISAA